VSGDSAGLSAADLIGVWHLRSWVSEAADGIQLPMGEDPEGVVVYTADGTMITTIGRAGRTPIDGGDIAGGPEDQRLEAMSSFIAYSGTFRIEGGDVLHSVTMSLFPNWIGTTQRRHVALSAGGRRLTLSADPFLLRGRLSSQALVWERVGD
jgi:hypothetical protein